MHSNSDNNSPNRAKQKKYAPSRFVIGEYDEKWRLCAGAAVLNSNNDLLIGERIHMPDSWQAPQGGVDAACDENDNRAETIVEAACREIYEEMGLVVGKHIVLENDLIIEPIRYETQGTNSWLTKEGFAGQELHWTVFRCMDGQGDSDPNVMCDLKGKGGEDAEFTKVKWETLECVMEKIWPNKRLVYQVLKDALEPLLGYEWYERCSKVDLEGRWSRDSSLCTGLVEALEARGHSHEMSLVEADKPYIQEWSRTQAKSSQALSWNVKTFATDGITVRRELQYEVGTWTEKMSGNSVIMGPSSRIAELERRTAFLAEPDAGLNGIAHCTLTSTLLGTEESRRYRKGPFMVLKRTFWPRQQDETKAIVSTEKFSQIYV